MDFDNLIKAIDNTKISSRQLDISIHKISYEFCEKYTEKWTIYENRISDTCPSYSSDIGKALKLLFKAFPNYDWEFGKKDGTNFATIKNNNVDICEHHDNLCICLLKTLVVAMKEVHNNNS